MRRLQHRNRAASVGLTYRRVYIGMAALAAVAFARSASHAGDALLFDSRVIVVNEEPVDPIVGVSTHWEIQFGTVNTKSVTPQVIAVMSPDGTVFNNYMLFELNHSSFPEYSKGGLQLQVWDYDMEQMWDNTYTNCSSCRTTEERIRFTMEMDLVDDKESSSGKSLLFAVRNLESETWGKMETVREFRIGTKLTSLNGFSPQQCMAESGLVAGASQVQSMKIDSIDYRYESGRSDGDSTDYSVYATQTRVETKLDYFTLTKALAY